MNIQDLTQDLSGTARDVAHTVNDVIDQGRDILGEAKGAGASKASAAIDKGSSAIRTLSKLVGAYASIKTLQSALDVAAPVARGLHALGLERRPSTFSRVLTGVGLVAVGAAAGAGAALLLAPQTGEQARKALMERLQALRGQAEGVAHDVGEAARSAAHTVEATATNAVNDVSSTAQNLVEGPTYGGSDEAPRRVRTSSVPSRALRAPRAR